MRSAHWFYTNGFSLASCFEPLCDLVCVFRRSKASNDALYKQVVPEIIICIHQFVVFSVLVPITSLSNKTHGKCFIVTLRENIAIILIYMQQKIWQDHVSVTACLQIVNIINIWLNVWQDKEDHLRDRDTIVTVIVLAVSVWPMDQHTH